MSQLYNISSPNMLASLFKLRKFLKVPRRYNNRHIYFKIISSLKRNRTNINRRGNRLQSIGCFQIIIKFIRDMQKLLLLCILQNNTVCKCYLIPILSNLKLANNSKIRSTAPMLSELNLKTRPITFSTHTFHP